MRFGEHFGTSGQPILSFEVFPPKTEKALAQLESVLPRLAALCPHFMTVTYGAFGSTQTRTLEIAARIRSTYGIETASHLTCVGSTVAEIDAILDQLLASGIENIVALRGDPPGDATEFVAPEGGFSHANELVAHLCSRDQFGIAVAGYPEKHVEAPDLDSDIRYLKQKVDAGADVVVTQLFYDNADFFSFAEKARAAGVSAPIVPGLLTIQSLQQIIRLTSMCGATIPAPLREQLDAAGDDAARVREVGIRWTIEQCEGLLEKGVPGIHFYVLNRAPHMEQVIESLRRSGHLPAPEAIAPIPTS